jgi:hypothetical protein
VGVLGGGASAYFAPMSFAESRSAHNLRATIEKTAKRDKKGKLLPGKKGRIFRSRGPALSTVLRTLHSSHLVGSLSIVNSSIGEVSRLQFDDAEINHRATNHSSRNQSSFNESSHYYR